jgi:hypothetical protein
MPSKAATVEQYLAELPADRRTEIERVREVIRANLDPELVEEGMQYGMIGWYVPHRVYPDGYHCNPKEPLPYGGLAAQKNYCTVSLMGLYMSGRPDGPDASLMKWFAEAWRKSGKKLDMGAACIRFKKADDLALDVLGEAVRRLPARRFIEWYRAALDSRAKKGPTRVAARTAAKAKGVGAKRKGVPKQALPNRGNRRGK